MTSPIRLYEVGGISVFDIPKKGVISYLVFHDPMLGQHFSYEFVPTKMSEDEARRNFEKDLRDKRATLYNPDGGRLDGKDLRGCAPGLHCDHSSLVPHGGWEDK